MFWFQTAVSQGRRAPHPKLIKCYTQPGKPIPEVHKSLTTPQMMSCSSSSFEPFRVLLLQIPTLHLLLFTLLSLFLSFSLSLFLSFSLSLFLLFLLFSLSLSLFQTFGALLNGSKLQCDTLSLFSATESACRSPQKPEHHLV